MQEVRNERKYWWGVRQRGILSDLLNSLHQVSTSETVVSMFSCIIAFYTHAITTTCYKNQTPKPLTLASLTYSRPYTLSGKGTEIGSFFAKLSKN